MKTVIAFFALVAFDAAFSASLSPINKVWNDLWAEYKKTYNKTYATERTEMMRRSIWEYNLNLINEHNQQPGHQSYWMGINEFTDLTNIERRKFMNGFRTNHRYNASLIFEDDVVRGLPKEIDWRKEGYVTNVKNQGKCGSCWAFSTTGSLEGQYFKKTGKLVSLSEQDLLDCTTACNTAGCEGGLVEAAFACIIKEGGIESEADYRYKTRQNDRCLFDRKKVVTSLTNYVDIDHFNENALQKAVATIGPVSVAIDASDFGFAHYKKGIYVSKKCNFFNLDHAVLVVGYGTENGQDYWLVKNSWGASWGMDGYIKMARNLQNMCGIATLATYPIL